MDIEKNMCDGVSFQENYHLTLATIYETRASHEVKGGAANNEFGSMAFDKL